MRVSETILPCSNTNKVWPVSHIENRVSVAQLTEKENNRGKVGKGQRTGNEMGGNGGNMGGKGDGDGKKRSVGKGRAPLV